MGEKVSENTGKIPEWGQKDAAKGCEGLIYQQPSWNFI